MSEIVVIGGGIAGLSSAMLLARDGHHVTLLERDPAPPPEPTEAWAEWERRGVNQFRLPHYFLARFREVAEPELPDAAGRPRRRGRPAHQPDRPRPRRDHRWAT